MPTPSLHDGRPRTAAEIIAAVGRDLGTDSDDPDVTDLAAFVAGGGLSLSAVAAIVAAVSGIPGERRDEDLAAFRRVMMASPAALEHLVEIMDAEWWTAPAPRPPHPLSALISEWRRRPLPAAPFVPRERAALPRLSIVGPDEGAALPDLPSHGAPPPPPADGQPELPGIGADVRGCASWLLWLFDQAGGESMKAGRGAPWDLRLFVYALLHLAVPDRDGQWHTIERPTEEVIRWLHPDGWANKRRDWHRLPEALDRMLRLAYVPVPGIGSVALLFPSVIPRRRGDPLVEFTVRIPAVAAAGDRLRWPLLVKYGADSARMFRSYLAVTAWLGRSASGGHPITRTIAAPVRGPDGRPKRRKGGVIVRSTTERIRNPAARYVGPPLSDADLARMIGFDPTDRRRRSDARAAFGRLEDDGVIEVDRSGGDFLIYGGPKW